jgi:hypothetical protein
MAIINKGKSFANGEQLTADKLNQVIDNATFTTSAVDNVSTQLAGEAIIVKDGGVTTAKLNDSAVTTAKIADANVTFAKLTDVIDDDTMATATDATLATSESIKAYVDSNGITQTTGSAPYFGCRAFGAFDGTAQTPITPISSGNIESITRVSTGSFEVTFTTPMPDANYAVVVTGNHHTSVTYATSDNVGTKQTNKFEIVFGSSSGLYNPDFISFAVFK